MIETKLDLMETRLQVMEKQSQETKLSTYQGDADTSENIKSKDMIKEIEEKITKNMTLNSL